MNSRDEIRTFTNENWDQMLLDYGLAMQAQDDYYQKMRAATTVTEEQHYGDLWEEQSLKVSDFRGKMTVMVKNMAIERAAAWSGKQPTY